MVLRSDELANQTEIEKDEKFRSNVKKGIATAASLGSAAISGALVSKVMPFLNEYIPTALAVKGISKVSPKLGSFLQKGQQMGLDVEEGLDFLKEKLGNESAKDERNIIQKYDDKLHESLERNIKINRLTPAQAIGLIDIFPQHKKSIEKIEKDHKVPFLNIVEKIYGNDSTKQQPSQEQIQQPPQQTGQGQAALMSILQKLQQSRGVK